MSSTANEQTAQPNGDSREDTLRRYQIAPAPLSKTFTICVALGGVAITGGTTLFAKIHPTWADPLQVGIAAGGFYLVLAGLLWRWYRRRG